VELELAMNVNAAKHEERRTRFIQRNENGFVAASPIAVDQLDSGMAAKVGQ
jgi:hypothetical protein